MPVQFISIGGKKNDVSDENDTEEIKLGKKQKSIQNDKENIKKVNKYLQGNQPVFILFHMNTCPACQTIYPIWSGFETNDNLQTQDYKNINAIIADVESEYADDILPKQDIQGFPTMIMMKNGKRIGEYNDSRELPAVYEWIMKSASTDYNGGKKRRRSGRHRKNKKSRKNKRRKTHKRNRRC
jgi:thioredoxin-like negative regulator of GroEL